MVRPASFDRNGMKKGAWSEEEDNKLKACNNSFGHPNWRLLPLVAGLKRCGKSCRLRWVNYLKPGIRRGNFTKDEEDHIIELHKQLGNKWSAIAAYFDGRTDNDIKNYWHAHIQKRRNRAKKSQNLQQEEQSYDDDNSCITTHVMNQDMRPASEVVAENTGAFELNAESNYNAAGDLEEELYGVGLWKEDIMSILFDYSDSCGIASWNLSAAKSQPEPVGEEFFNIELW